MTRSPDPTGGAATASDKRELGIRPMTAADIEAVAAIERHSYRYPWSPASFSGCLARSYDCWLVCDGAEVAGYGIVLLGGGEAQLLNLCVAPPWRRRGVARLLLGRLLDRARYLGADTMFLEVRPSNEAALRLYEEYGFCEVGRRNNYYRNGSDFEHGLIMARALDTEAP